MNRKKRFYYNTVAALIKQFVAILCGFILPRQFLMYYGSEINGLVSSISQFLSFVSLLDMGVSTVVQTALYKPLATKNQKKINEIVFASRKFFRRISMMLFIYTIGLMVIYPSFVKNNLGYVGTSILIFSISFSLLGEYMFGITNQILLDADQKSYIQYFFQIITLLLNTIICIFLMKMGLSITYVKLCSSLVFLARPIMMEMYVKNKYSICKKVKNVGDPIKQKWNGLAHHIASFIFGNTDIVILTLFSTLQNVSIYSIYLLVVSSLNRLTSTALNSFKSVFGDMYARKEKEKLKKIFYSAQWITHTLCTFLFSCTVILILPLVKVYTNVVSDVNYNQPLFAYIMILGYGICCIRNIYNILVISVGHFRQTQTASIIEAIINIVVSVAFVYKLGLIGVAIGTLVAILYKQIYYVYYLKNNIIFQPYKVFLKFVLTDILTIIIIVISTLKISLLQESYLGWFIMSVKVGLIAFFETCIINFLIYKKESKQLLSIIKNK